MLRDICANPADNAPRLIYADWLDEHDQPERAEFIRVQCELARLMNTPCSVAAGTWKRDGNSAGAKMVEWSDSPPARCCLPYNADLDLGLCYKCARIDRLLIRQRELHEMPADRWHMVNYPLSLLAEVKVKPPIFWHFGRGFAYEVSMSVWTWVDHGQYIVSHQPIERLQLVDVFPLMRSVYGIYRPCLFPALLAVEADGGTFGRARYPLKLTPALLAVEGVADSNGIIYCQGNQKALYDKACAAALAWARQQAGLSVPTGGSDD